MLRVFDAVGFDLALIETVGVGQTELDVMYVADEIAVVVVPESGDSIQAMKAGLMEIATVFVVNKADRPGAEAMARELEWLNEGKVEKTPVLRTTATEGDGVNELVSHLKSRGEFKLGGVRMNPRARLQHEALALSRAEIDARLRQEVKALQSEDDLGRWLRELSKG